MTIVFERNFMKATRDLMKPSTAPANVGNMVSLLVVVIIILCKSAGAIMV